MMKIINVKNTSVNSFFTVEHEILGILKIVIPHDMINANGEEWVIEHIKDVCNTKLINLNKTSSINSNMLIGKEL